MPDWLNLLVDMAPLIGVVGAWLVVINALGIRHLINFFLGNHEDIPWMKERRKRGK